MAHILRAIDRLKQYITSKGLSDSAFEKSVPMSNGYISKSEKGTGSVGSDILKKIADAHPDFSLWIEWVVTGSNKPGTKLLAKHQVGEPEVVYLPTPSPSEDAMVKMPVLDLQLAAGASALPADYLQTVDTVMIPRSWVKRGTRTYTVARVKGDSMSPTLLDAGYVVLRLLDKAEWKNTPNEHIYAVVSKDGGMINAQLKRVKNRLDKGFLVMMSDNPDKASYPNFNILWDDIVSIWHVEWYFTSRMPNIHDQYYSRLQTLEDRFDELLNELKPIKK